MDKKLFERIDEILWEDWDPIGINDYGGPKDEYQSYVPSIARLLNESKDESKISELLLHHANLNMGLSTKLEDHKLTATKLLRLKE